MTPTHKHTCEPVGSSDIADRLSLRPNTIAVYKTRGILPPERWFVSGLPVWCWQHDIAPNVVNGKLHAQN